jgi:hypothetical protein
LVIFFFVSHYFSLVMVFFFLKGFISFIVEPSLVVLGDMIDKIFDQILSEEQSRTSKSDIGDPNSEPM